MNLSIFDVLYEKYTPKKKIRLIEFFAGYGSQALALKYLGVKFEHWKTCEWAVKSIQAYKDLHFPDKDYWEWDIPEETIKDVLYKVGISSNYNEPMTKEQIKRLSYEQATRIYQNILINNNLVNIQGVRGKDLDIEDTDKYDYILSYSFPCMTSDSLILTEKGYIPYNQIKIGMKVLTKGNTWEKVIKKFDNGIHQTYYLNGMGFENIHVTKNHKFYVREMYRKGHIQKRYFKEPIFKEVKDINKNDYFGLPVIEEEKEFYTKDLDFWFMLGMYIGDGWLSKTGNDIIISCNDKKLKMLKERLDIEKYKYTINDLKKTCHKFRFANKEIYKFIKDNIGTGSENKHIPIEIIKLPKKQLQSFYDGYLNSDGCIVKNKHQFSSINKNLIYSISLIINKLYKRPTSIYKIKVNCKKEIENRIVNQKDWYQLRFKLTKDKQDKAFYENGYIWYPFKSLEKAEKENVYNMEVENDHSYIIQGCISKNCQDLSLAGKRQGMSDTSTRSGMLWEVERILTECKELGNMPQILLMENVPQVHSKENLSDFNKWQLRLEELGYKNYFQDLIATDYKIPQTRNRCFMISILGNYNYTFPKKTKLELKLKDMLEKNVEEKYFLSDKQIEQIKNWNAYEKPLEHLEDEVCGTLTTRSGAFAAGMKLTYDSLKRELCNKLIEKGLVKENDVIKHSYTGQILDGNKKCVEMNNIMPTLTTRGDCLGVVVPEATKKGYAVAKEGDGVYINRPHQKRGVVQKDKIQTLKTSCDDVGVVVIGNYSKSNHNASRIVDSEHCAPTVMENHGTITTTKIDSLRIRKLTSKECFRLMGVKDEDFEKIRKNQSDSSLYHLAGDSIVTTVLMAIFGELFNINWEEKIDKMLEGMKNE